MGRLLENCVSIETFIAAGAAVLIAALFWFLGRKPGRPGDGYESGIAMQGTDPRDDHHDIGSG